ncbi:MAG: HD domain-containing protein [Fimbriimonadaceae bacterium]|nr:HD domain-containing protein [Fimbriimonadaceae bacterium]
MNPFLRLRSGLDSADVSGGMQAVRGMGESTLVRLLSGLSLSLDLVEGHHPGHAIRVARFAMLLARPLELSPEQVRVLVLAALLKDSGCSAAAHRVHRIFGGDDRLAATVVKFTDWSNPYRAVKSALIYGDKEDGWGGLGMRLARGFHWPRRVMQEIGEARRLHGSQVAAELGCPPEVAQAIRCLDEHFDGSGAPQGLRGEEIPLAARILTLAQTFDEFAVRFGLTVALRMLAERSGSWFDSDLVAAVDTFSYSAEFWEDWETMIETPPRGLDLPGDVDDLDEDRLDLVCSTFARIIDAKSVFTAGHSSRVARMAAATGRRLGHDPLRVAELRRAGWLHDIAKLGVPTAVLDKPGRLSGDEASAIRATISFTRDLLHPLPGLERVGEIAWVHHRMLDDAGVWRGLTADSLDQDQQILALADMFDASVSERPYKTPLTSAEAMRNLHARLHGVFDPAVISVFEDSWDTFRQVV